MVDVLLFPCRGCKGTVCHRGKAVFFLAGCFAVALGLFGLGRVTFYVYSVYVLGLFSSPLGVPEVSLRNPVQE